MKALLNRLFRPRPSQLTRLEVARIIEAFLHGRGGARDWDDFISLEIEDKALDAVRIRCAQLSYEFPTKKSGHFCGPQGLAVLQGFVDQLRK